MARAAVRGSGTPSLWLSSEQVCDTQPGCEDPAMTTLLYTHPACLEHDPGRHHPESPARLRAVLAALDDPGFSRLNRREAPEAALEDLLLVHPRQHVEHILGAVPKSGHVAIDADTVLSP